MKFSNLLALALVTAFAVFSQTGCQQADPGRTTSGTSASSKPEPEKIDEAALEAELLRIQRDWPRAVKEKDVATLRRLTADDMIMVYPDGTVGTKEQEIKDIESGAFTVDSWEMTDLQVKVLNASAAGVIGRSIVKGKYNAQDGRVSAINGQYRFANTYARRNGEWKLVVSATAPVDRPPAETASPEVKSPPAPISASPTGVASPTT